MKKQLIGIYGASGFGREVMPVVRNQTEANGAELVFIDDDQHKLPAIDKEQILTWTKFLSLDADDKFAVIAIGDSRVREKLLARCQLNDIPMFKVLASNVMIGDDVVTGHGAILQPFVTLTSNIRIGRCFHANIYSYVAHDCQIGDYVTFAPGVMCNGNVHIGDGAYIGAGAVLRQGTPDKPLKIGSGAVVGMGAVVTKDVLPDVTVVGNPARVLEKA